MQGLGNIRTKVVRRGGHLLREWEDTARQAITHSKVNRHTLIKQTILSRLVGMQ